MRECGNTASLSVIDAGGNKLISYLTMALIKNIISLKNLNLNIN
jgi:hypothetical protein